MIRTLVVDDDYRVARLHAEHIDELPGYACVGEAHSAAEARKLIARLKPQLLLLDVYLPDEDGLSLLRSLRDEGVDVDAVVITAAQDAATVREAMRGGVVYYLAKPFGARQLTDQLEAYRKWRDDSNRRITGQRDIDKLFASRHGAPPSAPEPHRSPMPPTMQNILDAVLASETPMGAQEVSALIGVSRPTAHRYLSQLERKGHLELVLEYKPAGRPENTYRRPSRPSGRA
ncbi:response regulator transcription factor [Sinomonas sp. G460-2]|uniref:response regulator transcription factor n=1 Tax=Sinomonas sp. G460-2 TaxID=3393464 RepID=UPI0039F06543